MRELSIFIDESGDFGPFEKHSPFYILSLVFHDQSDDITGHLDKIHAGLRMRGLPADHAVHAGPLIRREQEYRWMELAPRRAILRLLVDFLHQCDLTHHSWVFTKRELDYDQLVSRMSRELGALIRENFAYFAGWDRIVIYYDNGQKEITTLVNSVFNALLSNVEVRKVVPSDYSLFQVADLCCTLTLVRQKIETGGVTASLAAGTREICRKSFGRPPSLWAPLLGAVPDLPASQGSPDTTCPSLRLCSCGPGARYCRT